MILNAIKARYSVRNFKDKEIEQEKLDAILEAARLAPSARNLQDWHFVVIKDKTKREQLSDICNSSKFVSTAPVTIAVCAGNTDYTMTCGEKAYTVDAAIAGEHIALQAASMGLGSCWIGSFDQDKIAELIKLPDSFRVVTLLPIGYPDSARPVRNLKPISEIVSYDQF
jgi:nitroreductase